MIRWPCRGRAATRMSIDPQPELDADMLGRLAACERRIGYIFANKALLLSALTHASGAEHRLASNERLEFLGDAILGAVVCEIALPPVPRVPRRRSDEDQVDRRQPADLREDQRGAGDAGVPDPGQGHDDASQRAAVAAGRRVRVAGGGDLPRRRRSGRRGSSSLRHIGPEIELAADGETGSNYKSLLQQLAQREHGTTPTYQLLDEKGPDHSKCFKIAAQVGRQPLSAGLGTQQEGSRAAGRPQRPEPAQRRQRPVSVGLTRCSPQHVCQQLASAGAARWRAAVGRPEVAWLARHTAALLGTAYRRWPQENRNARSAVPGVSFSSERFRRF